jgi:tartrate dehydratase beta subunit/fumarate hydratase class I family protein
MLFVKYPVSLNVVRKLKASDQIVFTGRLVLLGEAAFQRIVNYERAEGLIPDFIKNELICLGRVEQNIVKPIPSKSCEQFLEKAFLYGAVSVVAFDTSLDETAFKRFSRVLFVPESEVRPISQRMVAYADLDQDAVYEIEVERLVMRVAIDSKGNKMSLEVRH